MRIHVAVATLATISSSCGRTSDVAPTSPAPIVAPNPPVPPNPLALTTSCFGPFHPGEFAPLACVILVTPGTAPESTGIRVSADLSAFGRRESSFSMCPACGGPPITYDMDLTIPASMTPGQKTFPVSVTDDQGRRADTTGTLEIRVP